MKRKKIIAAALAAALVISQTGIMAHVTPATEEENSFSTSNMNRTTIMNKQQMPMGQQQVQQPGMQQTPNNIGVSPINQQTPNSADLQNVQFSDVEIDADDTYLDYQWYLKTTNSYMLWDYIDDDGDNETVYVAVLDTGVDYDHPDLENRVDESEGYDFVNGDGDAMDDNGHGTHVAGIIAAEMDNGEGIVGVTGDLDVVIIPIKVLDEEGSGNADDVVDGIEYATDLGYIDIINLSFGTSSLDDDDIEDIEDALEDAMDEDIFVVAAAGNDSEDTGDTVPANIEGVYTIAASGTNNLLTSFSNYGDEVAAMAPGEDIMSTYLDDAYALQDGTSMAAPIVTGIAAMLRSYDEDISIEDITDYLDEGCNYLDSYDNTAYADDIGQGLIDAAGAYEAMTDEDIYDEDEFQEDLESVTGNPTTQTPQNLAPNMNVGPSQRSQSINRRP